MKEIEKNIKTSFFAKLRIEREIRENNRNWAILVLEWESRVNINTRLQNKFFLYIS